MKRIKRFNVLQTAKVAALIYFFISIVLIVPIIFFAGIIGSEFGDSPFGAFSGIFLIFIPFVYAVIGFIVVALMCLVYNLISSWIGGIEVEIEDVSGYAGNGTS